MNSVRQQLDLFEKFSEVGRVESLVEKSHIPVQQSTFLGGVAARVHRWFRLTPSFGPELVRESLAEMETSPKSVILDPFSGAGTTLVESKLEGHTAIGLEINPFLHFVCKTSLDWEQDVSKLRSDFEAIGKAYHKEKENTVGKNLEELGLSPPPIHNVFRWWREDVLVDLLLLLKALRSCSTDLRRRRFFELSLAGVLVPDLTNVTLGRLQLFFINRDKDKIDVWDTFEKHSVSMISDVDAVSQIDGVGNSKIFNIDCSRDIAENIPQVDRVVTSPPYPNRYSYVWNTRPYLYLLGYFDTASEASGLDKETIGGTWGTATSVLKKGEIAPQFPIIEKVVEPVASEIRKTDNLMANYLMKYFNKLASQIVHQDALLANNAKMAYVVGCSRLKGIYVETDVLLAKIFEGLDLGYSVWKVERFRRRHSGKDLHESTVYVRKE